MCMKSVTFRNLKTSLGMVFVVCSLLQYSVAQTTAVVSIPEDKSNFHIFFLMGQSNMEGCSSVDGDMDTETDPRILKLNKSEFWEVAKDPISNDCEIAVGPGLQFAKKLIAENPDITIGLVPLAVGGTEISFWSKPNNKYYETLYLAKEARKIGTIKGFLWHQGEGDTGDESKATSYDDNLRRLIDSLRIDLRDPYIPFIVGGFPENQHLIYRSPLRGYVWNQLKEVGLNFPFCGYARSSGVPYMENDPVHFTSDGQRIMGERYANEYQRVVGFWTEKGKEWLDSEAEVSDDGWKYHPELGIYWDQNWPIIKHAQLGWLKVDIDEEHVIRVDSPFIGKFRIMQEDGYDNAIYIFTENLYDPEIPTYGVPIYVDLTREPGDPYAFYDHAVEAYIDRLPGLTVIEDTWDLNSMVESEYYQTQLGAQYLRNEIAADENYWSQMRWYVDDVVYHRNYTNYIGWEGYHYSDENETGNLRTFWMDKFYERLYYIDDYVIQAQVDFQNATNVLLSQ